MASGAAQAANGAELLAACEEGRVEDALRLVGEGADVDFADSTGFTPLLAASIRGDEVVVMRLVEAGAKIDLANKQSNQSALSVAAYFGQAAVAQLLAARMDAAALNLIDVFGKTALDWASEGGAEKDKVAELAPVAATIRARGGLAAVDAKALLPPGAQLLWACKDERAEDALRLISEGADLNFAAGVDGRTPLMTASAQGLEAIAVRLVDKGALLDLVDKDLEMSAISIAAANGHAAIAQMLVDKGAKIDLVDKLGRSALNSACWRGHPAVALLLAARMDVAALNVADKFGKAALDYASEGGRDKTKSAELAPVAAAIRARGGLTGTASDLRGNGGKQLLEACEDGRAEDALRLVSEGVDPDIAGGKYTNTPLIEASLKGLETLVARLVEAGARIDQQNEIGTSALSGAAANGHAAIAQLLLDKGAKIDLANKSGASPLARACYYGHPAVAQLLAARMDAAALNLVDVTGKSALDHAAEGGWDKTKAAELAPVAAAIRARGGLAGNEIRAGK